MENEAPPQQLPALPLGPLFRADRHCKPHRIELCGPCLATTVVGLQGELAQERRHTLRILWAVAMQAGGRLEIQPELLEKVPDEAEVKTTVEPGHFGERRYVVSARGEASRIIAPH